MTLSSGDRYSSDISLTMVRLTPTGPDRPVLVVGPSLGSSVGALWGECAASLGSRFDVIGWELPGHGQGAPAVGPFTVGDLADQVVTGIANLVGERQFAYAGDSIGGAVGLALLLDHPQHLVHATLACTGARIGAEQSWRERAALVRAQGTGEVVEGSIARWFAPGGIADSPAAATLLDDLRAVDDESYALTCEALASFDVRARLPAIDRPLTVIAGAHDTATPVSDAEIIVGAVSGSRLVVLAGVAHLAPIEDPRRVAEIIGATADRAAGGHLS